MILQADTCACIPNSHPIDDGESCECDSLYHWNDELDECVLDTSTHGFTWEMFLIGGNLSYFMDVEIINENDIWAVGEIHTDSALYNAARWDGEQWDLIAIAPLGYVVRNSSIYWIESSDIWFGNGSLPIHWNGETYHQFTPRDDNYPGGNEIYGIYGTSYSNMYFAGANGSVVHFDGQTFTSLDTGTATDLREIHVSDDGEYIFFQGYHSRGYGTVLLQLHDGMFTTIYECETYDPGESDYGYLFASYLWDSKLISVTATGIWEYNYITEESSLIPDSITNTANKAIRKIIGNSENDYILAANWWKFFHYNGNDFHYNDDLLQIIGEGGSRLYGGDMKGDLAAVCGTVLNTATEGYGGIAIGRR